MYGVTLVSVNKSFNATAFLQMDLGASEFHHCYEFFRKAGGSRRQLPSDSIVAQGHEVLEDD